MRIAPVVEHEVRRYVRDASIDASSPGRAAVEQALANLFGRECTATERRTFFLFAAPLVRRAVIDYVVAGEVVVRRELFVSNSLSRSAASQSASFLDAEAARTVIERPLLLKHWLARLESFDPQCVAMVDLHYFCGLSVRETAAGLGCSTSVVVRDLRFAKRWLQAYVRTWKRQGSS